MRILFFIWELPQNLLGSCFFLSFFLRKKIKRAYFENERLFIEINSIGAISLGFFIFYTFCDNEYVPVGQENKDHEFGHSLQSRILGPFYLILVGLSSEMRVIYAYLFKKINKSRWPGYYKGFPENWADRLGKVNTDRRPRP